MRHLFEQAKTLTRRDLLCGVSGLGALGALARRGDAALTSSGRGAKGQARCMILVNMMGAPSHLDTWDAKDAAWNPRDANLQPGAGGVVLSKTLFPGLLGLSNELCLVRSISSWEAEHTRGQFYLQTGHPSNPAFAAETPSFGAIVSLEKGGQGALPPYLALNGPAGEGAKFLGGRYEPMVAPANQGGLTTLEHPYFGTNSQQRFNERYQLLQDLDAGLRREPFDPAMAAHASFYDSAKKLMYDPAIVNVFRFTGEDNNRYGNTAFGRACIVARNAVRARNGVSFINLRSTGWDTHFQMFDEGYNGNMYELCRPLDTGLANLMTDLKESGDLDTTLIVAMGEFGRTPGPLNARGGRDHHKYAMSALLAGGGVKGGTVIGATDANGDRVDRPGWSGGREILTEDLTATFFVALGIDWTKGIAETPSGRKFEYVSHHATEGYRPVMEVFG